MEDLKELRRIAEAATPGPWEAKQTPIHTPSGEGGDYYVSCPTGIDVASTVGSSYEQEEPDALHIATFDPPTVLALLARLEQAEHGERAAKSELQDVVNEAIRQKKRAIKAEQAVSRVRAMAQDWEANGNSCAVGDRSADVWHATANAIRRALDGDGRG